MTGQVSSWAAAALWLVALEALLLASFPFAFSVFPGLKDRGFGVARLLGLAVATYVCVLLATLGAVPYGRESVGLGALALVALSGAVIALRRREVLELLRREVDALLVSEGLFLSGFAFFGGLRAFNPSLLLGEKTMDLSILNALLVSPARPVTDPWLAGVPLVYHTFGYEMAAFLTRLTGLPSAIAFNLLIGFLGGAVLQAAFSFGVNAAGKLRAGLAAAFLAALAGNLAGPALWLAGQRSLDWRFFWATSRVVPGTIDEFPLWSLVFADLHAHVFAIPLLFLVLAAALQFVRLHASEPGTSVARGGSAALLGFAIAVQVLTNTWDLPLLLGLVLLLPTEAIVCGGGVLRALANAAGAGLLALFLVRPLWVPGRALASAGWSAAEGASGREVVTVFGLFLLLAFLWALPSFAAFASVRGIDPRRARLLAGALGGVLLLLAFLPAERLALAGLALFVFAAFAFAEGVEERLAAALLATSFFLILFPRYAVLHDRSNTFFKLWLEAWLLFAAALPVLLFGRAESPGAFDRRAPLLRLAALVLALGSLFTSLAVVRGSLAARPGGRLEPTLDGLAFLRAARPGEVEAAAWLARAAPPRSVVLETPGASFSEGARFSTLTGLPTVLGWEEHVLLRGGTPAEVTERREAVRRIYAAPDAASIEPLLARYRIAFVVVGPLERRTWPEEGLRKLDGTPRLFRRVYENGDVRIYRVGGGS